MSIECVLRRSSTEVGLGLSVIWFRVWRCRCLVAAGAQCN